QQELPLGVVAAAALHVLHGEAEVAMNVAASSADPHSPWNARDQWWPNIDFERELPFVTQARPTPVRLRRDGPAWLLTMLEQQVKAVATAGPLGRMDIVLDDVRETVSVTRV